MAGAWTRLGLIAGGGDLPVHVAEAARAEGRLGAVVALDGFADPARFDGAHARGLGELGGVLKDLARAKCDAVCFAGIVSRPDFSKIKPDLKGLSILPKMVAAAARGDDALLRTVIGVFEAEGLAVVGADEIARELTARAGFLGAVRPDQPSVATPCVRCMWRLSSAPRMWARALLSATGWCWPWRPRRARTRCWAGSPACPKPFAAPLKSAAACWPSGPSPAKSGASICR